MGEYTKDDIFAARDNLLAEGLFPKEDVEEATKHVLARLDASPGVHRAVSSGRQSSSECNLTAHPRRKARNDHLVRARHGDERARAGNITSRRPLPIRKTTTR